MVINHLADQGLAVDGSKAKEPDEAELSAWIAPPRAGHALAVMLREDGVLMVHERELTPAWPIGPAFELLLALHELAGDSARRWSRRRLWTTLDRPLDRAAVQVGARRGRFGLVLHPHDRLVDLAVPPRAELRAPLAAALDRLAPSRLSAGAPLLQAHDLAARARRDGPRSGQDRAVGAVLVAPDGRPLLGATNQARENRLLHAEVVVLLSQLRATGRPLTPGHRLFTTLQPCRLCAALAVELGVSEVIFDEREQGRFGQATALAACGREREATEAERRGEA